MNNRMREERSRRKKICWERKEDPQSGQSRQRTSENEISYSGRRYYRVFYQTVRYPDLNEKQNRHFERKRYWFPKRRQLTGKDKILCLRNRRFEFQKQNIRIGKEKIRFLWKRQQDFTSKMIQDLISEKSESEIDEKEEKESDIQSAEFWHPDKQNVISEIVEHQVRNQ